MFIRLKRIRGNEYAYLVENKYRKKGVKQKVKGYLGRYYELKKVVDVDFKGFIGVSDLDGYIAEKNYSSLVNDLVRWELVRHGFRDDGDGFVLRGVRVYLDKKSNVVLGINEGYFCWHNLCKLSRFKTEDDEMREGFKLAKVFVDCGIKVPEDVFVKIYQKVVGE